MKERRTSLNNTLIDIKEWSGHMNKQYYYDCIEKGIILYWQTLAKPRGMTLHTGDIEYVTSNDRKGPERIFNIHIAPENLDERIDEIILGIKTDEIPDGFLITPNTSPENLAYILKEKGFSIDTSGLCMAVNLDGIEMTYKKSDNIKVIEISDTNELRHWVEIVNTALFEYEIMSFEQFYDIFSLDNTRLYIALYNDTPVSVCMTINDGETAVLEMVATLKEYRKKGLATTVINKALMDLHKDKIRIVSLRAEPDGINLYKKIGFKEYCKRVVACCS